MSDAAYRVYFGDRPATRDELDRVEEIMVEQEMDMAWEARVRLFLCLDENGNWRHQAGEFAQPFSRVRVELKIGDGAFVPLIDGPVAGCATALDSQPGRSSVTLVVRDDSVFMNREEENEPPFENRTDDDIADEVLHRFPQIGETRVQSPGPARPVTVRRGTPIQFLRELARPHGYHAYVLPGAEAGRSIGCFLPDPEGPGDLPPLTLLGTGRNLADVNVTENAEGPARTQARSLRISDQQIVSAESSVQDLALMRPLPPFAADLAARRQLAPEDNDSEEPEARTHGRTRRDSYAYRLTARVVPGCYEAVLTPYQKVSVRAGDLPFSGDCLLTKVTHHITPSLYTQELEAKIDSASDGGAAAGAGGALGLSVDFSASISIF